MSRLFDYKYLSIEHLKGFSNYKYSSIDNSPLAVYVSHPFWNQVVKLYPMWLAPNVLTFGGMLLVMAAFGLVSYYDYNLTASNGPIDVLSTHPVPNWVWLFCSIAMFLAHTMGNGTDGKQARRTGASGPTGELFDHGIDSWMTIPFTVTLFSVFGRTDYSVDAFRQMLILMSVQLVFVTTHWEKYNTGILFLSWCYDASQYALVIMYFVTWAAGGYLFWKFYLIPGLLTPAHVMEYVFYFSCFGMSIPMSLYNIQK
uniref:Ethanolaminephosphotransferase 1 n=1 Tax=Romanomermis culicivorax TaxID=13658 RepID=A0A915IKY1_ROMCU